MGEVVDSIGFAGITDGFVGGGVGAYLVPEEFVGVREFGSEARVEQLLDLLVEAEVVEEGLVSGEKDLM